jgi:ribosomal protein S18 acetylase RimI-like enzyme
MSNLKTLPPVNLLLRRILLRDLPCLAQIEQRPPALRWTSQDWRTILQSPNTAGWVADIGGRVVGYLIYVVRLQPDPGEVEAADGPARQPHWARSAQARQPLHITILNLAVAPDWQRRGLGQALLDRVGQGLQHPQDRIQVTVPESNLPVQLLLRDAGYKAVRVLRGYFEDEDAYLMERQRPYGL